MPVSVSLPSLDTSKITTGKYYDAQMAISTGAFPGGFNGPNQLVKLDIDSKLPIVDGSWLTNLTAANIGLNEGLILVGNAANKASAVTLTGGQILVGDSSSKAKAVTVTGNVTIDNTGLTTIAALAVTSARMAQEARTHSVVISIPAGAIASGYVIWKPSVDVRIIKMYVVPESPCNASGLITVKSGAGDVATFTAATQGAGSSNSMTMDLTRGHAAIAADTAVTVTVDDTGTRQNIQIEYVTDTLAL